MSIKRFGLYQISVGVALVLCLGTGKVLACLCPYVEAPIEEMVKAAVDGTVTEEFRFPAATS